ncbi:HlyD family efflux transporter periplasmic adaptor subunit [Caulobacter sp. 602-1]|uniref:HlyD family efflux transporter periplasmic adaptor subunit n=1 Tax=Caulobacter sp. 602-1 TaxID=2492472 RepID=UPI0013151610|nr:HlyD family efflux transporter periplasmic adaptor subunit [Caulobacter sp. 602-1]
MRRVNSNLCRVLLTLVLAIAAIAAITLLWRRYGGEPWTREARLAADSVPVSTDAPGLVTRVLVTDNQFVRAGAVLFLVDRERYGARLERARAEVARARLERGPRAAAQLRLALAERTLAQLDFERSSVRAPVDGYVEGLTLRPGRWTSRGEAQFTLVAVDSFHVMAPFEETKLRAIKVGDTARIDVLGEPRPLWGHVESLAAQTQEAGKDQARPGLSWVRPVQRVTVRIAIDETPGDLRPIAGRTASVRLQRARPLYGN